MNEIFQQFKQRYLIKFWNPTASVIAAGVLSAYYFGLTGTNWAVTGELTRWGGHILQLLGVDLSSWGYYQMIGMKGSPLTRGGGLIIIGMLAGCFIAALWANNVKLRLPQSRIRIVQALIGGIIAGFGARLAMGCNLAAFFTGIPQFSLHTWYFTLASAIGTYFGAKFTLLPIFRIPIKLKKGKADLPQLSANKTQQRFWLGSILFVAYVLITIYMFTQSSKLGFALLFGLAFGLIIERAQICFTSAFRDLWISGRSYMLKAIIFGMLVSAIGVFSYVQLGVTPKTQWAAPNAIIGGLLFGFGIVLAGGCETGWMYRAVEGQIHFWWVGIGNVIGATLLAACWESIAPSLALNYEKINLLTIFGPLGGLAINYGLLILSLILVVWWEKRFLAKAQKQH